MRSSVVVLSSSRPITRPPAGMRNAWTVGCAPVHTTSAPGAAACDASGMTSGVYPPRGSGMSPPVVTFDAGQTLIELDLDFLARRLGERAIAIAPAQLAAAEPGAWRRYDALVEAGYGHPWQGFMTALLEAAGVEGSAIAPAVDWLYR